jgi:glycosyltransferase involved in cell wall biosynthesis
VYTFNGQGLELLSFAREHGLRSIMEQTIAPKEKEIELITEERNRFDHWTHASDHTSLGEKKLAQREQTEWQEADLILCGSEFVMKGIRDCDGPVEKCQVVPYGTDVELFRSVQKNTNPGTSSPVRVVTVGSVGLRKGSPYVLQAARKLKGTALFRMVGAVGLPASARSELKDDVELVGHVPRSEVVEHYEWADIFLLPSLCEGSAGVTYEAMANGLPVICTRNTGSIVRDGQDGFIVPIRDAEAIAERIMCLAEDENLYQEMSRSAKERAVTAGSVEAYGKRLVDAIRSADLLHAN